ncbi:MAG: bifunctional methylenetetrahydrofolate dehydrogenase/methenyltetrahydrofolate cyclohydrolase FolD [Burkholderiales bacterium]|jgi:methylenetetrahydrofolate dehydrogenase (NADP+)/methenyltetrahydrofolate cyclohydrolase
MSAKIIDGKSLAIAVRESLAQTIQALAARGVRPGLAVVLAGDDSASRLYVRNKIRACEQTGLRWELHEYAHDVPEATLVERIEGLNNDRGVHGILIQLPLPRPLDVSHILDAVSPAKDVDGFHLESLGALAAGRPGFVPCTPAGIMRMLEHERVPLSGRHAVVVGRSNVVGKPLALLLLQRDATVTICHSKTPALAETTRHADVLVAAVGRPGLITADMVKPGACVIDVGTNRLPDGKLAGDVDFDSVKQVAGLISPVPGGVGPMTVAMLIANTVRSALQIETR